MKLKTFYQMLATLVMFFAVLLEAFGKTDIGGYLLAIFFLICAGQEKD